MIYAIIGTVKNIVHISGGGGGLCEVGLNPSKYFLLFVASLIENLDHVFIN